MPWPLTFLSSQLFFTPPLPITSLSSQVYLVTGANTGLGLAACAHLARCNAALIVLAVRSSSSGEAAIASLVSTTGRPASAFKLEILDLASYESVVKFGERVRKYERLDAVIQNAGILPQKWEEAEGMERTVVVNDISAVLLGMLLLPALRNSAQKTGKMGRLVFVGSDVMMVAKFGENKGRGASGLSILEVLSDEKRAGMGDRCVALSFLSPPHPFRL
jgi:NAD(P)-dependent dehydrogenase (short-subunit alcohol dehydrogenase family)